jgi:hypothetical protein
VVIPLAMQHYMLLQRNLIYTGITRGKRLTRQSDGELSWREAVEPNP